MSEIRQRGKLTVHNESSVEGKNIGRIWERVDMCVVLTTVQKKSQL